MTLSRRIFLEMPVAMLSVGTMGARKPPRDNQDLVLHELTHELASMHKDLKTRGFRAEHVRSLATALRVAAAHAQASGIDDRAKAAVIHGMPHGQIDTEAVTTELLDHFGLDVEAFVLPPLREASVAEQTEALRQMRANGVSRELRRMAKALDKLQSEIAIRFGKLQDGIDHYDIVRTAYTNCDWLDTEILLLQLGLAAACLSGIGAPMCLFLTAALIEIRIFRLYMKAC